MSVIAVDFSRLAPPASVNLDEIKSLTRKAAAHLGAHVGKPAKVQQVSPTAFGAYAQGYVFRLGVIIGSYSTIRKMPPDEDVMKFAARRDAAPREVRIEIVADVEWLRDQSFATSGDFGHEYASLEFKSVEEVSAWILGTCHKVPVSRLSAKEIAQWKARVITVGIGTDKERKMPFCDAAGVYGQLYRHEITIEALVENHGISPADAAFIFREVSKVLPKRKPPAEKT